MSATRPEEVLRSMVDPVPFNRYLRIRGELRMAVTQGSLLVAEGLGVYNIHRRPAA